MTEAIWIINHFAVPPDAPGGTRHYDFGVELAKRGCEVAIFASDFNYMLRKRVSPGYPRKTNGVRFVWVRSLRYKENNWRRAANMLSFALNAIVIGVIQKRPDVIIGSSPHLLGALSAYILARIKGCKFHLEVRDLWPQVLIDMESASEKSFLIVLLRKIESLLYQKAERIIVLSEGAGRYITGRGIDPEKLLLLPNGVYLEQFQVIEDRETIRERQGLADKFVVMYTGAHGLANALHTIVRSAALCPEVVFMLVGDGPCKNELQQMIAERSLDNVKMLPAVPKRSIPDLLNAADALVITLRSVDLFSYGVSPNKLFEYMASGKPVLCAVNGEVANLVTRADAGMVVEPENPEALARAALSLMTDRDKCSAYGANGRKYVAENFSRSRIVDSLVSIL